MKNKRIMSLLLAAMLMMAMLVPASAASITSSGGTGTTTVQLTAEPATFSVTLPTTLALSMDGSGNVTAATTAKIVNNSSGSVKVTNVTITGSDGWETQDYDTMDTSQMLVNSKKFALDINGCKTTGANAINFQASKFPVLAKYGASGGANETTLTYAGIVAPQADNLSNKTVANVVFTVAWNT